MLLAFGQRVINLSEKIWLLGLPSPKFDTQCNTASICIFKGPIKKSRRNIGRIVTEIQFKSQPVQQYCDLHSSNRKMASTATPTTQLSPAALPPSVFTLPQTAQLEALYTIIRDKDTKRGDFLFYSDRIIRLLVEEGLNHLPVVPKTVQTPTVCTK